MLGLGLWAWVRIPLVQPYLHHSPSFASVKHTEDMRIPSISLFVFFSTLISVSYGLPNLGTSSFMNSMSFFNTITGFSERTDWTPPWWFDFWSEAKKLGNRATEYAQNALKAAADEYPDVSANIQDFKVSVERLVNSTEVFDQPRDVFAITGFDMGEFTEKFSLEIERELEKLKKELQEPLPEDATERSRKREAAVSVVLDHIEGVLVRVYRMYNVPELEVRAKFGEVRPHIKHVVLVVGNVADKHPMLVELLIFSAITVVFPEGWILRPALRLLGFGSAGPVGGSAAAWAQRFFFRRAIPAKSWFSMLQRAGMTEPGILKKIKILFGKLFG
ncbi:unnamed protein product [Cyclocybe aegerita]|uniref:Uncharacterized protein n=1 Tax=Cyclocybe aegerita TaxID=1973307 RepID=A0A8S0XK58_CYCAE|nr:unnamed protein product [Cyclocybe aegerita]